VDIAKCGALSAVALGIEGSGDPHQVSSCMIAQIGRVTGRQIRSSEVCVLELEE